MEIIKANGSNKDDYCYMCSCHKNALWQCYKCVSKRDMAVKTGKTLLPIAIGEVYDNPEVATWTHSMRL